MDGTGIAPTVQIVLRLWVRHIEMRKYTFVYLAFWVAAANFAGAVGCADGGHRLVNPAARTSTGGMDVPIRLLDLDGNPFDMWQAGLGKVSVVVFTRSDCPISNRYAPDVRQLYESFHPQGVDFYLIYVDPNEQPDAIRDHLHEYGYPCPGLRDPEHTLVSHVGATVTPEAVVFDGNRRITYRGRIDDLYAGLGNSRAAPTKHDLHDAIEATVAGRPVVAPDTTAVGCYIGDLE